MTSPYRRLVSSIGFAALALLPARAWAVTQTSCSFPQGLTTYTLNQNAFEALNSEIRLTDNVAAETGSAFLTAPIAITATTSFHAYFRFQIGPTAAGGDGLAFVLHNSAAGAAALGTGAGAMGYGGLTPSVIVEFDTFKNTGGDTNANHVGLMLNGSATTHTAVGTPTFTMAGAGVLSAWIDYDGVGHTINVYLATTATKPTTPIVTHALTLYTQLLSAGQMYVGFTGATNTGTEINEHDVLELELSTTGVPCACEGDSACSGATPACATSGVCAICSATNDAACTGATPVCDVPVNTCVGCLTNATCADPKPICDKTALACRACATNADCSGSTPECATTGVNSGDCVLCVADANCPPTSPRCTTTNTCVQCISAADCGGDTPVCNGGLCKPCASDANCGGATPACEVWGACGQCSATNGSACVGGTDVCDFPSGTCVACEFNSDCSGMTPTCNPTSHTCQPCATNADCAGNPEGPACVTTGMKAGSCVICAVDADCTSPAAPKCDTVANQCVACLSSTDCSAPTPVCNNTNLCVGCLTSADCSGATPVCDATSSQCKPCANDYSATNPGPLPCPTPALAACEPAGTPLAGQCTLCSSLNDSACASIPTTPVCITSTATCGCVVDTDCNPDSYCDTSTVSSGVCTAGCRVLDGGASNCSTAKYCSATDGTVGTCTSEPCNSNTDCKAPLAVCDTIVQPHVCVQCLNDPDCSSSQVCDATNHCVQCTTQQTQNCTAATMGAACLASETCGCATDMDCGNATSGRICDTTKHTCEMGCRGTGGNGCPPPQTCSSMDGSAGTCATPATAASSSSSSSSSGAGGSGGSGGAGGEPPMGHVVTQSTGCACRAAATSDDERGAALGGLLLGLALCAERRRHRRETPAA
jgi:Legume lectin domain